VIFNKNHALIFSIYLSIYLSSITPLKSKEAGTTAAEQKNEFADLCNPPPPGFQAGEE
jgi:hypothetical protein